MSVAARCSSSKYAGTASTARDAGSPANASTSRSSSSSTCAPTSSGVTGAAAATAKATPPPSAAPTATPTRAASSPTASKGRPINRFAAVTVLAEFDAACSSASAPTSTPPAVYATTDGVVNSPRRLGTRTGAPFLSTATAEFVVPRSMPMVTARESGSATAASTSVDRLHAIAPL